MVNHKFIILTLLPLFLIVQICHSMFHFFLICPPSLYFQESTLTWSYYLRQYCHGLCNNVQIIGYKMLPGKSGASWQKSLIHWCRHSVLGLPHCLISHGMIWINVMVLEVPNPLYIKKSAGQNHTVNKRFHIIHGLLNVHATLAFLETKT